MAELDSRLSELMKIILRGHIAQSSGGGVFLSRGRVEGWMEVMLRQSPELDIDSAMKKADEILLGMNYEIAEGGYAFKRQKRPYIQAS